MKKIPFRLTPIRCNGFWWSGFVTVGYALYVRYLAVEFFRRSRSPATPDCRP